MFLQFKKSAVSVAILGILTLSAGCANLGLVSNDGQDSTFFSRASANNTGECIGDDGRKHYIDNQGKQVEEAVIRTTGYGAPPKSFYPEAQRRLMAMRAAKIDALRNLAERVSGVQIWGGTTIGDMVVEKDRFRVYLDTHLRGAKVIGENPLEDGSFETIVELKVGQHLLSAALTKPKQSTCIPTNMKAADASSPNPSPIRHASLPNTRNGKNSFYMQAID